MNQTQSDLGVMGTSKPTSHSMVECVAGVALWGSRVVACILEAHINTLLAFFKK